MIKKKDAPVSHGSVSTKEYTQTLAHLKKMVEQAQIFAGKYVSDEELLPAA